MSGRTSRKSGCCEKRPRASWKGTPLFCFAWHTSTHIHIHRHASLFRTQPHATQYGWNAQPPTNQPAVIAIAAMLRSSRSVAVCMPCKPALRRHALPAPSEKPSAESTSTGATAASYHAVNCSNCWWLRVKDVALSRYLGRRLLIGVCTQNDCNDDGVCTQNDCNDD